MSAIHNQGRIARLLEISRTPLFCLLSSEVLGTSASSETTVFTPGSIIGILPVKSQFLALTSVVTNFTSQNPVIPGYYPVLGTLSDGNIIKSGISYSNFRIVTSLEFSTNTITIPDGVTSVTINLVGIVTNLKTSTSADQRKFISKDIVNSGTTSYTIQLTRKLSTPVTVSLASATVSSNIIFNV